MSVFPYAYRMIESFHVTQDPSRISIYAGMLITAFAFAEFSTGMLWGRVSDRIGRKPVLIMGLVGTALSMICFGFSTNLWMAILSRALGGLLNGNVGVLQTTVAELVKKKEHQPRAYSIMPFVWCLGSIIGPAMGGALAMPCDAYPWLFPRDSIFDKFPFLLPNLVCVVILGFGILNGLLFIEETHPEKRFARDPGRQAGQYLVSKICYRRPRQCDDKAMLFQTDDSLLDPPPGYRTAENSPLMSCSPPPVLMDAENSTSKENRALSVTFSRQVILIIIGYGILAYHSVSFDALMPVFLSESTSSDAPSLPFKFVGGFGKTTKQIGYMMAVQGVYAMFAQLWLFPLIVKHLGTLKAFRGTMLVWPLLYFTVPYLVLLPTSVQNIGLYGALLLKMTFHVIAFPSNAILLANATPSKAVLGTINGVAASTACLCRALGPTLTGAIHTAGLQYGYTGLAWWFGGIICALGALEAFYIEETDSRHDHPTEPTEEQAVCEPLITATVEDSESRADPLTTDNLDLNQTFKA